MPIVGSTDTWRNRMAGATDVELATLDRDIEPDHALRPVISDEILRRSTEKGGQVAELPIAATPAPDAPNISVTIPTAPTALAGVPGAPTAKPGGSGEPPSDPVTLAKRAQMAIEGGDQQTALEIYDFGLQKHGQTFIDSFNALEKESDPASSGGGPRTIKIPELTSARPPFGQAELGPRDLPVIKIPEQPAATPLSKDGPLPTVPPLVDSASPAGNGYLGAPRPVSAAGPAGNSYTGGRAGASGDQAGRDDQETSPPGVPAPPPLGGRALPEPPEPAPYLPQGADAAVAGSLREAELATTKYRADQLAKALGPATRDARALIEAGLTPEQAITEALKQPGVAKVATADDLRRSLDLPPAVAPPAVTPPAGTPAPTLTPVPTPGGGGLATLRGTTAAGTAVGQQRLDDPNVATPGTPQPPPSGHWGKQPDGSYIDVPPGNEVSLPEDTVTVVKETGRPARMAGDPRSGGVRNVGPPRQMAAPPNSGSLPSTVQPPPAVDTGTNAARSSTSVTNVSAGPAVDTGTNTPQADDSGFMSKPDIWSFLTSAGLGAMASGSTSALGAIGAGGTAGINQLGVLRKDQRERAKNLADAEFQKARIKLGYYDTQHADQRTTDTLRSGERNTDVTTDAANRRNTDTLQSGERNTDRTNQAHLTIATQNNDEQFRRQDSAQQHAVQQAERASQLRQLEADYADHIRDNNLIDDATTKFDFAKKHGASDDDALRFAGGHAPPTETTHFSPMTEKESTAAYERLAADVLGAGRSFEEINKKLSLDHRQELEREMAKGQSVPDAAARGQAVLKKYGYTTKDDSWLGGYAGEKRVLVPPRTSQASPSASPSGGGGGGNYVWDKDKKVMVPK
jgi:hypothetical protein